MKNEKTLVIFGAPDHEERVSRKIAAVAGCAVATATYQGKSVHAGNVYKADGWAIDFGPVGAWDRVIFFECGSEEMIREFSHNGFGVAKCDHHRPGDYGYNKGPSEFYNASSLGQLGAFLGLSVNGAALAAGVSADELLMTAAGDHCPKDVYAGKCGIDPEKFFDFRIRQKAEYLNSINKVMGLGLKDYELMVRADIYEAIAKIGLNRKGEPGEIIDLTGYGTIPELPEAAMRLGVAYKTCISETDRDGNPTGNDKILLGGCTTPNQVKEFMAWAVNLDNRVGEPYGNPTRGYAGVVVHNERLLCVCCGAEIACANINTCPECGTAYPDESVIG